MKQSKDAVATHEAGHAIVILATPLREYVKHARLYRIQDDWFGDVQMDGRDRAKVDPKCVYEVAKGLGGPLAQVQFFPESIPDSLAKLIEESGGVLEAAKRNVREELGIESHWWPDLRSWTCLWKEKTFEGSDDFMTIEEEIDRVFRTAIGARAVAILADQLAREDFLSREQLLAMPTAHLPSFSFPDDLRGRYITG